MLPRLFGCVVLSFGLFALAVDAGGGKKDDKKEMKDKKDAKKDAKREFNEKEVLVGVVKSVDKKEKTFTLAMEKSKKDRTFGISKNTEFFGPRGGDRNDTGIDDECMAPGYTLKVVPTANGTNAAQVQFDVAKTKKDEKKDEKKKAA